MGYYSNATITWKATPTSTDANRVLDVSETHTEETTGTKADYFTTARYSIADSGTESVDLGEITTVTQIWIKADQQVKIKVNGQADGFLLGHTAANGGWCAMPAVSITQLDIDNSSGSTALVDVKMVGV